MNDETDQPDLENRMRELERGMRIFIATPVVAISLFPIWTLFGVVPKFERVFEDMLGAGKKLPDLTLFVLAYHTWIVGLIVVWVGFCVWAAVTIRRFTRAAGVCGVGIIVLLFIQVAVQWALWAPIGMIFHQWTGGSA